MKRLQDIIFICHYIMPLYFVEGTLTEYTYWHF